MARARNIKPGFFKNEDLAECSLAARLCFAGLWTLADREGRLEDRPKRIKAELFAFDSLEVEPLLVELERNSFIHRYKAEDGRGLIQILQFSKHQNPHHREPESELPPPQSPGLLPHASTDKPKAPAACKGDEALGKTEAGPGLDPPNDDLARGSSRADSGFRIPDSGTLIPEPPDGGSGSAPSAAPPPSPAFDGRNAESLNGKTVALLSDDFELPEQWGLDAERLGWLPAEVLREAEKMRQWATQGKGKGTRRNVKGWRQTWSNWLAKAAEGKR